MDTIEFIMNLLECTKCWRLVPNKNYFTKNGCLWCDPKGDKDGTS